MDSYIEICVYAFLVARHQGFVQCDSSDKSASSGYSRFAEETNDTALRRWQLDWALIDAIVPGLIHGCNYGVTVLWVARRQFSLLLHADAQNFAASYCSIHFFFHDFGEYNLKYVDNEYSYLNDLDFIVHKSYYIRAQSESKAD